MVHHVCLPELRESQGGPFGIVDLLRQMQCQFLLLERLIHVSHRARRMSRFREGLDLTWDIAGCFVQARGFLPRDERIFESALLMGNEAPLHEFVPRPPVSAASEMPERISETHMINTAVHPMRLYLITT